MVPGETESVSVLVHGPAALVENVPADELERSVTAAGRTTAEASDSSSGADGTPAMRRIGSAGPIVSVDWAHVRKDRHAPLCRASAMSTAHNVSPAPHAPLPG